jgi:hypothetical protein
MARKVNHSGDRVFSLFYFVFLDLFFVVDKLVFKGFRGVYQAFLIENLFKISNDFTTTSIVVEF